MSTIVEQLADELKDQPRNPLRPYQVKEHTDELARVRALAGGLDQDGRQQPWMPGDRGAARQRMQRIQKVLHEQAPKPIEDGARKDKIARLTSEVITNVIAPSMLTEEEMRRNPAGAVGAFLRREGSKPVKDAILTARRGLLALEPDNDDPDYLNMERFRRQKESTGAASFMADAQIRGNFAQTPLAKQNWPLGEPTARTALVDVLAREQAAGAAVIDPPLTREEKKRRTAAKYTPEQREAFGKKMKAAREAKAAQANG